MLTCMTSGRQKNLLCCIYGPTWFGLLSVSVSVTHISVLFMHKTNDKHWCPTSVVVMLLLCYCYAQLFLLSHCSWDQSTHSFAK